MFRQALSFGHGILNNTKRLSLLSNKIVTAPTLSSSFETLPSIGATQVQTRGKKEKKNKKMDPEFAKMWWNHKDKEQQRGLQPKYTNIILIKECDLGMPGEVVKLQKPKASLFVQKRRAVYETPTTRKVYLDAMHSTLKQELQEKSEPFHKHRLLDRCVVIINRKIIGPKQEFFWPVTPKDVANHIWNNHKLAINPELLKPPKEGTQLNMWKKPGLYLIHYPVGDKVARIRLYLRKGGNTWDGFPL